MVDRPCHGTTTSERVVPLCHHHEVSCDGSAGVGGVSLTESDLLICQVDLDVLVHAKQMRCIVELEIPMELVLYDA